MTFSRAFLKANRVLGNALKIPVFGLLTDKPVQEFVALCA
jgi:hypothetical protein